MITEFIGQGLSIDTEESIGNYICSSIKDVAFIEMNFFVAFMRSKGLSELKPFIKKAHSESRKLTIYVGIDEKVTSKEALEMLLKLNIETYIYNSDRFIYHPKIYLFEGSLRNRIIVGSSNLTKTGLFYNVESAILLDFTSEDKTGQKVLNQLKNYYSPLFDFSSDYLDLVTPDLIKKLLDEGKIAVEKYELDEENSFRTFDNYKKRIKNPEIVELGNLEINEKEKVTTKYELKITEEYLEKWDEMFERLKKYKEKYGRTTVSKDYEDRTLFGWYQKQKRIYNDPNIEMPSHHYEKLKSIDFHFEDGHKEREKIIENKWIGLLKQAIESGEDIRPNHRYFFNGETLGTWLVGIAEQNKEGRKLDVKERIESMGFKYHETSRKPEHVAQRYVDKLLSDPKPQKMSYQNHFNSSILPKKSKLSIKLIKEIEEAWELQFNEPRTWIKGTLDNDRTTEWKAYRYNQTINSEGKWCTGESKMGKLYNWVYHKKKSKSKMDLVVKKFSPKELQELRNEGFPVD